MCLISIAGIGTDKYSADFKSAVREGMTTQTDGTGFAYWKKHSNTVEYSKGYVLKSRSYYSNDLVEVTFEEFWNSLKDLKLEKEDIFVIHHRTSTHGKVNRINCHPYEINPNNVPITDICYEDGSTEYGVVFHNGVFHNYQIYDSSFSDSANVVHSLFTDARENLELLKRDSSRFSNLFSNILKTNKLAILIPGQVITLGSFIPQGQTGYLHSNSGYLEYSNYRDVGGHNMGYGYCERSLYDEEDEYPRNSPKKLLPPFVESYGEFTPNKNNLFVIKKPEKSDRYKENVNNSPKHNTPNVTIHNPGKDSEIGIGNLTIKTDTETINTIRRFSIEWDSNQAILKRFLVLNPTYTSQIKFIIHTEISNYLKPGTIVTTTDEFTLNARTLTVIKTETSGAARHMLCRPVNLLDNSYIIPCSEFLEKLYTYVKLVSIYEKKDIFGKSLMSKNAFKALIRLMNSTSVGRKIHIKKPLKFEATKDGIELFVSSYQHHFNKQYQPNADVIKNISL